MRSGKTPGYGHHSGETARIKEILADLIKYSNWTRLKPLVWLSYAKNDSLIQGMTGPVGNINQPPGYTRAHFYRFTFSVYAVEDTINLSSNQLKCKMYNTLVVVPHSGYFKSRHDNAAPQKKTSMESVANFRAPNTIITKYIPLGIWRAPR